MSDKTPTQNNVQKRPSLKDTTANEVLKRHYVRKAGKVAHDSDAFHTDASDSAEYDEAWLLYDRICDFLDENGWASFEHDFATNVARFTEMATTDPENPFFKHLTDAMRMWESSVLRALRK